MISFIRGKLFAQEPEYILVDVNGIGYKINIHGRSHLYLPAEGEEVFIFTYLHVLDNEFKLYGFLNRDELVMFQKLLGVSGIGPRGAMSILGIMTPDEFYKAVFGKDERALTAIPGIGKKTAQRLIFELKDKIDDVCLGTADSIESRNLDEISEALEALGYKPDEFYSMLREMENNLELSGSLENNIKAVLKRINQKRLG